MKHSNLWDEIEVYTDTNSDRLILAGTILAVIISITLFLWEPPIEEIGEWVYKLINSNA